MSLTDAQRQAGEIFAQQHAGADLEAATSGDLGRIHVSTGQRIGAGHRYTEFVQALKSVAVEDMKILCAVTIMDTGVREFWKRNGKGLPEREIRRRLIRALDALVLHYGLTGDF